MDSLLKNFNEVSDGVFYSRDKKTKIDIKVIKELSAHVGKTKLRRARIEPTELEDLEIDKDDDFDKIYKGEISKSGAAILPSKRARKISEKIITPLKTDNEVTDNEVKEDSKKEGQQDKNDSLSAENKTE